jgi:hypothetical protein
MTGESPRTLFLHYWGRGPAPALAKSLRGALDLSSSSAPMPINFDADKPGSPPVGWTFGRTGSGEPGSWVVEEGQPLGASGRILVQRSTDGTDNRFPVAFAPQSPFADGSITVRCRPISGKVDQACGVVLRAKGENDYVVARANALEDNVRLYNVTKGSRKQFAGWNGKVTSGEWHTLSLSARGDEYVVTFDGKEIIREKNREQAGPGRAGLWTKADSVTAFDDVAIAATK